MDVRCGSCGTEYDFDDALLSERGTTVQCTECGFQFKVFPEGKLAGQERWIVRACGGEWLKEYSSVKELQLAIRRQEIGPDDLLSRGSGTPRPLASIVELEPLFLQATARSGGTLLGMVPAGTQEEPASAPPTKAMPGRHRVTTKLGLPTVSPPQTLGASLPTGTSVPPPAPPPLSSHPPAPPPLSSHPPAPPPLSSHPPPSATAPASALGARNFTRTLPSAFGEDSSPTDRSASPPSDASSAGGEDVPTIPQREWGQRPRIVSALSAGGLEDTGGEEPWAASASWGNQTLPSAQPPSSVPPSPVPPSPVPPSPAPSSAPPRSPRRGEVMSPLKSSPPGPPLDATLVSATPDAPASSRRGGELEDEVIVLPARRSGGRIVAFALVTTCVLGGLWAWSRIDSRTAAPEEATAPEPVPAVQASEPAIEAPPADEAPSVDSEPADEASDDDANRDREPEPEASEPDRAPTPPADGVTFQTRLTAASRALHTGDWDTAKQQYEAVLREHPGNVEALAGLADVAQRRGDATTAARLYEQVLAEHPFYVPALMGRGDQFWEAGDRTRAVQLYERVVEEIGPSGTYGQRAQARIRQATEEAAPSEPAASASPASPAGEPTSPEGAEKTDLDE